MLNIEYSRKVIAKPSSFNGLPLYSGLVDGRCRRLPAVESVVKTQIPHRQPYQLTSPISHRQPPCHPNRRTLLRLIDQAHIQKQLRRSPHRTLQRTPDPRMRIARVFADKHRMLLGAEVRRKIQPLLPRVRTRPKSHLPKEKTDFRRVNTSVVRRE